MITRHVISTGTWGDDFEIRIDTSSNYETTWSVWKGAEFRRGRIEVGEGDLAAAYVAATAAATEMIDDLLSVLKGAEASVTELRERFG